MNLPHRLLASCIPLRVALHQWITHGLFSPTFRIREWTKSTQWRALTSEEGRSTALALRSTRHLDGRNVGEWYG